MANSCGCHCPILIRVPPRTISAPVAGLDAVCARINWLGRIRVLQIRQIRSTGAKVDFRHASTYREYSEWHVWDLPTDPVALRRLNLILRGVLRREIDERRRTVPA